MCWLAFILPISIGVGWLSPPLVDLICMLRVVADLAVTPSLLRERLFELGPFDPSVAYPEFIFNLSSVERWEYVLIVSSRN